MEWDYSWGSVGCRLSIMELLSTGFLLCTFYLSDDDNNINKDSNIDMTLDQQN